jgi:endo-1,4-beta-xylanase
MKKAAQRNFYPFIVFVLLLTVFSIQEINAQIAKGKDKFLGNIYQSGTKSDRNFLKYWNQVTPENYGKWSNTQPSNRTSYSWTNLDESYNFAKSKGFPFRMHTLVWGQQYPGWVNNADEDSATIYNAIEELIKKVGERYKDLDFVDVVNEPLHSFTDAGALKIQKALGGKGKSGWDFVINAFKLARKYIPNAKLHINDYSIINSGTSTDNYIKIINLLKAENLIDGIGVQGHRFELENSSAVPLKANLTKLQATGLPVFITEFDLGNISNSGTPDDNKQLELYKRIFPALWEHPAVHGITLWGFNQGAMWQSTAFLLRNDNTERPALTWLREYVDTTVVGVDSDEEIPTGYSLSQNYPNPFNPVTTIEFTIPVQSNAKIIVYDMLGNEIKTLINESLPAGKHSVKLNGGDLSSGIYFYRIITNNFVETKKMTLLK